MVPCEKIGLMGDRQLRFYLHCSECGKDGYEDRALNDLWKECGQRPEQEVPESEIPFPFKDDQEFLSTMGILENVS